MDQSFSVISQIHHLNDRVLSMLLRKHPRVPVNAAQMRLIMSIWDNDEINMQEMSARNCLKKTTLSTMLPKMIEAGLIELRTSSKDHRARIIRVTEKAKGLQQSHQELYTVLEKELFTGVSEQEKQIFLQVLMQVKENLRNKEKVLESESTEE